MTLPVNNSFHVEQAAVTKRTLIAPARAPSLDAIVKRVGEFYRVPLAEMTGFRKLRPIVRPRHIAMWLARNLTTLSLPQIGRAFGGRDHTSILHGVRRVDELRAAHPGLKHETDALLAEFSETRDG